MQRLLLFLFAIIATILTVVGVSQNRKAGISGGVSTVAPTVGTTPSIAISESSVPLPNGEDVIRTFIGLINEHKIPEAIGMMDQNLIPSDSVKEQYGVVFNTFTSIAIGKIQMEEFGKENWEPGEEVYRVDLQITLDSQNQTVWEEGVNTRWIAVKKQGDGRFLIHEIATGP